MEELFAVIKEKVGLGEPLVLVSVVASSGSTPRGAGAKMLVGAFGRIIGTIGGGAIEHEAELTALKYLEEKSGGLKSFELTEKQIRGLGMVCGGKVTVYFKYLPAYSDEIIALSEHAAAKIKSGEPCWLITDVTDENGGKMFLYSNDGFFNIDSPPDGLLNLMTNKPVRQTLNDREYCVERLVSPGVLYIFGGGHIARELVPAAAKVGFKCVVLDDRPEFTKREHFPHAKDVWLVNFESLDFVSEHRDGNTENTIVVTHDDYIAIMTRGHQYDTAVQAKALSTNTRYIGVMGSRRKKAYVEACLREQGFTDTQLSRIKTPIGLEIGAETPEEIAVSIVAELIMVRAAAQ